MLRVKRKICMLEVPGQVTGLIIVDHGSKRGAANEMLLAVVAMFQRVSGGKIVEPAHMELAEPTIKQAFEKCVAQGATFVIVHPYFLAPGRHSTTDIPNLVAEAAKKHPKVEFHVTQPLGLDERIAHLMMHRIQECLSAGFRCESCRMHANCGTIPNASM